MMPAPRSVVRLLGLVVAFLILLDCASGHRQQDLRETLRAIPAKSLSSYPFDSSTPIGQRVRKIPDVLFTYVRDADRNSSYAPHVPSAFEKKELEANLELLPRVYRNVLKERLVGIYLIDNLAGSGLADYVLDATENVYGVIILNPELFRHGLSDWITKREQSCYFQNGNQHSPIRVRVDCGGDSSALTYALLHETSHVVDSVMHLTPYVEDNIRELGLGVQSTAFSSEIWQTYKKPRPDCDFPHRAELSFWGFGSQVDLDSAIALYRDLGRSPFSSLYGSMNWAEDFAEYVTWYYLTQILHQPYRIEVLRNDAVVYSCSPMESARTLRRSAAIASLLD